MTGGTITTPIPGLKYVYGVAVDAAFNVFYTESESRFHKQDVSVQRTPH